MAIGVTGATKWTANINGEFGQVLTGLNDVYVVQTTTSGSGKSTTITTSVLAINASTGKAEKFSPITPAGNISEIQIKAVGTNDYLYINSVSTTSSTSGGTTTTTTTQALSIYLNGTLVKTVAL
jgi:lipopolysaccharide export system protein LptC